MVVAVGTLTDAVTTVLSLAERAFHLAGGVNFTDGEITPAPVQAPITFSIVKAVDDIPVLE